LFSQRVLSRKQFLLDVGTQNGHVAARVLIEFGKEVAVIDVHASHAREVRKKSPDTVVPASRSKSDRTLFRRFRRDTLEQRHLSLQIIDIVDGEFNLAARLGTAGLKRWSCRK